MVYLSLMHYQEIVGKLKLYYFLFMYFCYILLFMVSIVIIYYYVVRRSFVQFKHLCNAIAKRQKIIFIKNFAFIMLLITLIFPNFSLYY